MTRGTRVILSAAKDLGGGTLLLVACEALPGRSNGRATSPHSERTLHSRIAAVPLTFVAGSAADVFADDLARAIDAELRRRFPSVALDGVERYESEPVDATGWRALQKRVLQTLDVAPQLTTVDAYQAVYIPGAHDGVATCRLRTWPTLCRSAPSRRCSRSSTASPPRPRSRPTISSS